MAEGIELFTPSFFRKLQLLKIQTRRNYLGSRQGSHLSKKRGHGLEFSDYRSYVPGDDYRHIDWGVYGRTDRLYVKEFREEQELQVLFLVDASWSMGYPIGEKKFEQARDIALSLGYVALSDGDTASFAYLGNLISPKYVGVRALSRVWEVSKKVQPNGSIFLDREVRKALGRIRIPGKCFLISDLLVEFDEFARTCEAIAAKNFELSIIHVLSPSELKFKADGSSALLVDAETGETIDLALTGGLEFEYAKVLSHHLQQIERYCQQHSIRYALVSSDQPLQEVVLNTLPELGLLK